MSVSIQVIVQFSRKIIHRASGAEDLLGEIQCHLVKDDRIRLHIPSPLDLRQIGKALVDAYRSDLSRCSFEAVLAINHHSWVDKYVDKDTGQTMFVIKVTSQRRRPRNAFMLLTRDQVLPCLSALRTALTSKGFRDWESRWCVIAHQTDRSIRKDADSESQKINREYVELRKHVSRARKVAH